MAQITLNIPDEKEQRFINAFASVFSWHSDIGITKKQFMKIKLKDYIKEIVFRSEISEVNKTAIQTLQTDIDGIDVN